MALEGRGADGQRGVADPEGAQRRRLDGARGAAGRGGVAEDGAGALKAIQNDETIDVVLTDVLMPGMTGVELLSQIRERRDAYLAGLRESGLLVLEGEFGEGGSLMVIAADSTNAALDILHRDPLVALPYPSRVDVRPFVPRVTGPLASLDEIAARSAPAATRRQLGGRSDS